MNELLDRLEKIQKTSGISNKKLKKLEKNIDEDFDEKAFNIQMQ